jgi:hypothetical protein
MTTLKASGLKALLDKARNSGLVEESVTISGLPIVLRSLAPEAYADIMGAVEELEGSAEYMYMYQIEHICRALIEIDGQDFRDVDTITVERVDPATQALVSVNVLRHEWLKDIVRTWGREVVQVAFRKFLDVTAKATKKANEGVEFYVQEETDEEKFRRLLNEAIDASGEIPGDMRDAILSEAGLLTKTTQEELDALDQQARKFIAERQAQAEALEAEERAQAEAAQAEAAQADLEAQEAAQAQTSPPVPVAVPRQLAEAARLQAEELMASRTPLNQEAIKPPVPQVENTQSVNPRPGPPLASQVAVPPASRAAKMAALEAEAGQGGIPLDSPTLDRGYHSLPGSEHTDVIEAPLDPRESQVAVDGPPIVGHNRHFVDPHKNAGMGGLDPRNRR